MHPPSIDKILLPIDFTSQYIGIVKQAAELAQKHGASIYLIHIFDTKKIRNRFFPWHILSNVFDKVVQQKRSKILTWKRWMEMEYKIVVETYVDWDNKERGIINYAKQMKADLIVLKDAGDNPKWFSFFRSPLAYIIEKSPCQVITFFLGKNTIAEWKQVVIPVTDFVPELRIKTIIDIAMLFHLKIHLVTVTNDVISKQSADFHFLTETLKRLKPAGNIQVECRCLEMKKGRVSSFIDYSHQVGADVLMTNMKLRDSDKQRIKA